MNELMVPRFSRGDIVFLLETAAPQLMDKIETISNDPEIIEGMMEHEALRLYRRIMLLSGEKITTTITPRFLFEVLLRAARKEMGHQTYTVERTALQRIPVFDMPEVARFLNNPPVLRYLADMLASFTRVESFTLPVRVRRGIWRKIRFNDMDINSLLRFCQAVDEPYRFGLYKRIADLCLFILGIFPEYVPADYQFAPAGKSRTGFFGTWPWAAQDYEANGRHFYKLAGQHRDAAQLNMAEILRQFHEHFDLAKKPLNYISEHFVRFKKERLFPSFSAG